jgi:hypothetical protein
MLVLPILALASFFTLMASEVHAQASSPTSNSSSASTPASASATSPSTSTDLFIMAGSDIDRPGALPRANYNIGLGHTFAFLKKDPIGDELTFAYTYENAGTHGFLHTQYGEHSEQFGVMKNFAIQTGVTSYTGYSQLMNHLDTGLSIGAIVHLSFHDSIWIQESYSKVVTVPWYTTSSIGYTYSW